MRLGGDIKHMKSASKHTIAREIGQQVRYTAIFLTFAYELIG